MNIAIITPTYNRKLLLDRLFKSLDNQNNYNFSWIIIDDGSTDETEKYVVNKLTGKANFPVNYLKVKNGGKARALNRGFEKFKDVDLFVVVDSDDILVQDAIQIIHKKAEKYKDNDDVGALYFRYKDTEGNILHSSGNMLTEESILNRFEHDSKYSKDDGCICYFKKVIQKYKCPEFNNENYVGPTVMQMEMATEFKIFFSNEVIGIAEYQANGLTQSGRKLRLKNPMGMIKYCELMQNNKFNFQIRTKYAIMSHAYMQIANLSTEDLEKNNIKIPNNSLLIKIFSRVLTILWKKQTN